MAALFYKIWRIENIEVDDMKYVLKRLCSAVIVLFVMSVVIFLIIHWTPGDPAEIYAGTGASASTVETVRKTMGLDRPLVVQYVDWLKGVFQGDFGISLSTKEEILPTLATKFINTLQLSVYGAAFAIICGIGLGVLSALYHNTIIDVFSMLVAIIGISMPVYWVGMLLVMVFSIQLGIFPVTGNETWLSYVLPSICIGLNSLAVITRMTRSSMLEVLNEDYIVTAVAKGLRKPSIYFVHALKNAMIPIITTIGMQFGYLMGGSVLTETVFVYPGLGKYLVDSIQARDYPAIQASLLVLVTVFIIVNFLVDLAYFMLNPRLRSEG